MRGDEQTVAQKFIGSAASGAVLASAAGAQAQPESALPWNREKRLRDAAESVYIESVLNERCPQSGRGGPAMLFVNPNIQSSVWGPANRITLSMIKNDVFDRRA